MTISQSGIKLFKRMLVDGDGSMSVIEQEYFKALDIRELIDSHVAKRTEDGVFPYMNLKLDGTAEEIESLKKIYLSENGVALASLKGKVRLSVIKKWIDKGLVKLEKRKRANFLVSAV